ncbi:FG-GAP repeat domain-containing protein [Kineosporia babensis]|uniref:VCBS repeat-containing protein n=1 Tax=Kineosporia babensis TaxID=499548 RepID=A0A9X1NI49_9ACTN|nr:VCBS repeat-containing protein [Kineosporia babensis]
MIFLFSRGDVIPRPLKQTMVEGKVKRSLSTALLAVASVVGLTMLPAGPSMAKAAAACGTFSVTNNWVSGFPVWAREAGYQIVSGDFNGDGRGDLAMTGAQSATTIPVAFSNGNGTFTVTNYYVPNFPIWARTAGYQVVAGDFNGDGRSDLAMTGAQNATTIPVAFSNGNGTFGVTNYTVPNFPIWAREAGFQVVAGDFNGDGRSDLSMTGAQSATTIPVAFSNGNGTFGVTNSWVANFPIWAKTAGYQVVAGDFNNDGRSDLAMTGAQNATTVPVAFSNGNGTFGVTNYTVPNFPIWAREAGFQVVAGDFNGDGRSDLSMTGAQSAVTIPVAFSNGNGTFGVTNSWVSGFPVWAREAGYQVVAGDFDGDYRSDLAISGAQSATTIPLAISNC